MVPEIGAVLAAWGTMSENRSVLKRRMPEIFWVYAWLATVFVLFCSVVTQAHAAEPRFVATPVGPPLIVFDPRRDACDGHDVPDVPLRAWRDRDGAIRAFALHYENRRMGGASLLALKPDCRVVFRGNDNSDPARYDDKSWIAATWTADGRIIHALAHHEFQAHRHKGRCAFPEYIRCWWNAILALHSENGGEDFAKTRAPVVAATPFPSESEQGRHRGFFNPSNIVEKDGWLHALIATTGWNAAPRRAGQQGGACLFRMAKSGGEWRAFDGKAFSASFPDPYGATPPGQPCRVLRPFPAPVGSVTRHRPSGAWLAVYQAAKGMPDGFGGVHAESGFYLSSSRDLLDWSPPSLVLETRTLYDSPCGTDALRSYPVLIDERAQTRNFEDIGDEALLFFSEMAVSDCRHSSERKLIARKVRISALPRE